MVSHQVSPRHLLEMQMLGPAPAGWSDVGSGAGGHHRAGQRPAEARQLATSVASGDESDGKQGPPCARAAPPGVPACLSANSGPSLRHQPQGRSQEPCPHPWAWRCPPCAACLPAALPHPWLTDALSDLLSWAWHLSPYVLKEQRATARVGLN